MPETVRREAQRIFSDGMENGVGRPHDDAFAHAFAEGERRATERIVADLRMRGESASMVPNPYRAALLESADRYERGGYLG